MSQIEAIVEAVCLSTPDARVAKKPQDKASIGEHGFEGDRHASEFVQMYGRPVANTRQWSAVSAEEVAALCADIGVAPFPAGALGENLRLSGVVLANVPAGSVLELPSGARLAVGGQNDPCVNAARELAQKYGAVVGEYFVRKAFGRRGVVGVVLVPGVVRPGDKVTISVPEDATTVRA
jgi:MOSC domain-containing protein YiiM